MKKNIVLICFMVLVTGVFLLSGCGTRTYIKGESLSSDAQASDKKEDVLIGPKRRIAVIEFENKTIYGKRRLGSSVADILVTELKKSGRFILIEREKINKILEEQKFQWTGAVDESTTVELCKIL